MRALLPLLACLALAGCGGSEAAAGGGAAHDGFPVTIRHQLGTAEIPAPPERVVALDFPSADTAIALGVVPVAMAKVDYADGGVQPWTRSALGGERPELIDTATGIPLEEVAAQRPDVILATSTFGLGEVYDKLSQIAPVVAWESGEGLDPWQDNTLRIGRALGREARARALVADVEQQVAEARDDHPEFDGATVSFFNFFQGLPYVINDPSDFSIRFLSNLGFRLPPAVAALEGQERRAKVSRERLDVLEADAIMGTSPAIDELDRFAHSTLFRRLDAVRRGAYVQLDLPTATSMAFPSPLSVPYGLREIVPQLAEAVR